MNKILRWGLPLFFFVLPWQVRYIFAEYGSAFPYYSDASLYAYDLLFLALFGVWVAWMIKGRRWEQYKHHSRLVTGVFEILLGYGLLSLLWSPVPLVSFLVWLRLLQATVLVLILVTGPASRRELMIAMAASGAAQGIIAVAQFFTQSIGAHTWLGMAAQTGARLGASVVEQGDLRWLRAYGSLPHPNILGGWLVLSMLAAVWLYLEQYRQFAHDFRSNQVWSVAGAWAAFLLSLVGLLLSFSRASWMGAVTAIGLLCVATFVGAPDAERKYVALSSGKLVVAAACVIFSLNALMGGIWQDRARGEGRLAEQSASDRAQLEAQANEIITANGWKGVGIGAYEAEIMRQNPGQPAYAYQPVHNVWLLIYAELGFAGFGLLLLWMSCWYSFVKSVFTWKIQVVRALPYAGILSVGLMAYFDHFWWTLPTGLLVLSLPVALWIRK